MRHPALQHGIVARHTPEGIKKGLFSPVMVHFLLTNFWSTVITGGCSPK